MPFHRYKQPSYASAPALPAGPTFVTFNGVQYNLLNVTSEGNGGTAAFTDGPKGDGANTGTYFVAAHEDARSQYANRGLKALAENTDTLDDWFHRDIAAPIRTSTANATVAVATVTLPAGTFVGHTTGYPLDALFSILDEANQEIVNGTSLVAVASISGATIGSGFSAGIVTLTLTAPIPAGTVYRIYYATRTNLASLPPDALTVLTVRSADELSKPVRDAIAATRQVPAGGVSTANQFLKMNAAGDAYLFASPVAPLGGLAQDSSGRMGIRTVQGGGAALNLDGDLIVRAHPNKGLTLFDEGTSTLHGLGIKLDPTKTFHGLVMDANGVSVLVNSYSMIIDSYGIGANLNNIAVLVNGRLKPSQRSGWIVDTFDSTPVATQAASSTLLTLLSIPGCQVGDVISYTGDAELDTNAPSYFYGMGCQIRNAVNTIVVSQPQTKTMGGGGRPGTLAIRKYVVATAGTHTIELTGGTISGTVSGNNIRQAHLWAQLMRPNP